MKIIEYFKEIISTQLNIVVEEFVALNSTLIPIVNV